jgi:hypothetical protein
MSLRFFLASLLAATGCTGDSTVATLRTVGGFAGVDDTIHLTSDGTVTLTTRFGGDTVTTVDSSVVEEIQQKIEDAEFPTLQRAYTGNCADDFTHTVTARVGAKSYTVTADGCADAPERLNLVIDALFQLVVRPVDLQ